MGFANTSFFYERESIFRALNRARTSPKMSITALVFVGVFGLGSLLTFVHPMFGLLTYLWTFYNGPADNWWGSQLPDLRWAFLAALITLVSLFCTQRRSSSGPWWSNWGVRFLVLFTGWLWIQNCWALDQSQQMFLAILFTKYIVVSYLICHIVDNEEKLNIFCWANIVGCFIWGWQAYNSTVSGRLEAIGGSDVSGANGATMQLLVGLIFAGFMFLSEQGVKRWILVLIIPFIVNAIILTGTRGGFVALVIAGVLAVVVIPRRYRFRVTCVSVLGILLVLRLGNELFWERIGTLDDIIGHNVDNGPMSQAIDKSAESRLVIARANLKMAVDHPLGVGHRGNEILSPNYITTNYLTFTGSRAAHNTFLAILVDHGFPGAIVFIAFLIWAVVYFRRWRVLAKQTQSIRLSVYAAAVGIAMIACLVAGQFSNFLKAEVQVWLLALMVAGYNLSSKRIAENGAEMVEVRPAA